MLWSSSLSLLPTIDNRYAFVRCRRSIVAFASCIRKNCASLRFNFHHYFYRVLQASVFCDAFPWYAPFLQTSLSFVTASRFWIFFKYCMLAFCSSFSLSFSKSPWLLLIIDDTSCPSSLNRVFVLNPLVPSTRIRFGFSFGWTSKEISSPSSSFQSCLFLTISKSSSSSSSSSMLLAMILLLAFDFQLQFGQFFVSVFQL